MYSNYAIGASTRQFALGKFIQTTAAYAVTDISLGKSRSSDGMGGLQ
jgi:hypothetical protein